MTELQESVERLTRDLREAAQLMTAEEARYLVDAYYTMQGQRIIQHNRQRAMVGEPHSVIAWLGHQSEFLEGQIKAALDRYSQHHPMGAWMRGHKGIGPVIAAGILGHIDITKCQTAGDIWRFAGLDPTLTWGKGEKRPYNARLKVLCWKLGESFKKFSGAEDCFYGQIYKKRKAYEVERNERGDNKAIAADALATRKLTPEQKVHYANGKLPPGRLDLRATRYAVKLFLAHLFEVWYEHENGRPAPLPYAIQHLGHAHKISPPSQTESAESTEDCE